MEVEGNDATGNSSQAPFTSPIASQSPAAMGPITPNASPFGIIVPGMPVRYDFAPVDGSGTKFALQLQSPGDLPSPLTLVNEVVGFLGTALPAGQGVLLYWQLVLPQEQSGFELLGALTTDNPSQILRTGWSEHDQFLSIPPQQPVTINIGLSIEPLEVVTNLAATATAKNSKRPLVAQKIAQDLYNFMQSFDSSGGNTNGQLVVPQNIFERWWKRFETKSRRDPNFFLKTAD